jgi:hypothetical protein
VGTLGLAASASFNFHEYLQGDWNVNRVVVAKASEKASNLAEETTLDSDEFDVAEGSDVNEFASPSRADGETSYFDYFRDAKVAKYHFERENATTNLQGLYYENDTITHDRINEQDVYIIFNSPSSGTFERVSRPLCCWCSRYPAHRSFCFFSFQNSNTLFTFSFDSQPFLSCKSLLAFLFFF